MPSYGYGIQSKSNISQIKQQLSQALNLSVRPLQRFKRIYLDSFDWRLFNKGYSLHAEQRHEGYQLQLHRLKDNKLISQTLALRLPEHITDIPRSRLKTLLQPVLKVRALLPILELSVSQYRLQQHNKQDKITAELTLENIKSLTNKRSTTLKQLWHTPIRGYLKENQRISTWLEQAEMTHAMETAPLSRFLPRPDLANSYTSRPVRPVDGTARSDAEIKQLLAFFLTVMRRNEDGIINDIDSEFLHDFRIAARRSRSLLEQMPGVIELRKATQFRDHLVRLSNLTSPLRDLDVMLLNFDDYRHLLPENKRQHLDPVYATLQQQRQNAHKKICRYLQSAAHHNACQRWHNYLQAPPPANTPLRNAKRPIKQLSDVHIWKLYRKALKKGLLITSASPEEELHKLRKHCKKLRYLLEFFACLYPASKIKTLITSLKKLQDNLGAHQDASTHIASFQQLRSSMEASQALPATTVMAIEKLMSGLKLQQATYRKHFRGCFKQFSSPAHQQLFKQLFHP